MRPIRLLFLVFLFLSACNLPFKEPRNSRNPTLEAMVSMTLQAHTPQASPTAPATSTEITATPTTQASNVSGQVCFRTSGVTQLDLYFEDTATNKLVKLSVDNAHTDYKLELAPGTYKVYAWAPDFSQGVLYNGGNTITVETGRVLAGVDFCNYSHGPFDVPYPPGYSPQATTGSVSGAIYGYPGGNNAQLTVVAFNQANHYWYYSILNPGVRSYSITELPPGTYQVVAYDKNGSSGGTSPNVTVQAGQDANANINDWGGNFPSNPVK